jgi:MFS family permease
MHQQITTEFRKGWPVILACFCVAVFAWGFAFYGQSVYLAELHLLHGWTTSTISMATTFFYLGGAFLMPFVHQAIGRFGPKRVLLAGIVVLGFGACAFSGAGQPWQLYPAGALMAVGWALTSGPAIATTLALWFNERRGLAISLALNGASASGFTVAPLLVQVSQAHGLTVAVPGIVACGLLLAIPVVALCVGRPPYPASSTPIPAVLPGAGDDRPSLASRADALRDGAFWSVSAPFALALAAQVGFIIHMVAFLLPTLGSAGTSIAVSAASVAAMAGRLALGTVIDRLPQRRTSAACFASQACGMGLMMAWPGQPLALFGGVILFGLSVGNVITLPAILMHREFSAGSFGLAVGLNGAIGQFSLALAPGLFGVLRDATGSYGAVLAACIGLQGIATGIILRGRGG